MCSDDILKLHETIDIMISGDDWGSKLRQAIANKATIFTEGEILLMVENRNKKKFPEPEDVPNGENLHKLETLEEGEVEISTPEKIDGKLVLKWKKVAFTPHRRFLEMFGFLYEDKYQFLGKLYFNDEELKNEHDDFVYGFESFNRDHFWENGCDFDDTQLKYNGKFGFNCTPLRPASGSAKIKWEKAGDLDRLIVEGKSTDYGDVCGDLDEMWVIVDFKKKIYAFSHHSAPYFISSEDPFGQNI